MKRLMIAFTLLCLVLFLSNSALANWTGAATGDTTKTAADGCCKWTSTLGPEPAFQMSDCSWMHNALEAQGFKAPD